MTDSSSTPDRGSASTWVVDQIENGVASVEVNGTTMLTIPVEILPEGLREGDVLRAAITQDPDEKKRRLARSAAQVAKGGTGGKGNITL